MLRIVSRHSCIVTIPLVHSFVIKYGNDGTILQMSPGLEITFNNNNNNTVVGIHKPAVITKCPSLLSISIVAFHKCVKLLKGSDFQQLVSVKLQHLCFAKLC